MSSELTMRLRANPRLSKALDVLPPKMLTLRSDGPAEPITLEGTLEGRKERVVARIRAATFTGKGDDVKVPALYTDYVERIVGALQPLLALGSATTVVELPPMPADTGAEAWRAWHLDVMRVQHVSIVDALSGKRLDTLKECVQMAVEGKDAEGRFIKKANSCENEEAPRSALAVQARAHASRGGRSQFGEHIGPRQ